MSSKRKPVKPKKFRHVDMSVVFPKKSFRMDAELDDTDKRIRRAFPNRDERRQYIESLVKEMETGVQL